MNLKDYIREISDYPKKGVSFKDISTLVSNVDAFKYYDDIPKINFEKLTEVEAKYPNPTNVKNKLKDWTNEYLSTKASSRVSSFRMSDTNQKDITIICNHLINEVINKGDISNVKNETINGRY